jgi:hypothetical protein
LDDWRLVDTKLDTDTELDTTERRAAPVEKVTGAVENTMAGGWPGGEEGWRAEALERGAERGWRPAGRGRECLRTVVALVHECSGEHRGKVVTLERVAVRTR